MRILHTSDWHLGRSFHGLSLHDVTEDLLTELVETVAQEKIDLLLVSGDVYDQAQPRTETIGLLSRTLEKLSELGCTVVLTSGNHDSAIRLGFAAKLLARAGVHLVTSTQELDQPILFEKAGQQVAIYALPYLEPRALAPVWGVPATHRAVLGHALEQARTDLAQRQVTASIVLAHCFASGASSSDSERDIQAGGIGAVGADLFEGFSYAALGHLHGRQKVSETVRYSGSLLAYSFSEENHRKGGWILDLADSGELTITEHNWSHTLNLKTLRGTLEELTTGTEYRAYKDAICRIYITDDERPLGALEKLREHFDTVAELYFEPANRVARDQRDYSARKVEEKSLDEVCGDFYQHVRERSLTEAEQTYLASITEQASYSEVSQ